MQKKVIIVIVGITLLLAIIVGVWLIQGNGSKDTAREGSSVNEEKQEETLNETDEDIETDSTETSGNDKVELPEDTIFDSNVNTTDEKNQGTNQEEESGSGEKSDGNEMPSEPIELPRIPIN